MDTPHCLRRIGYATFPRTGLLLFTASANVIVVSGGIYVYYYRPWLLCELWTLRGEVSQGKYLTGVLW